MSTKTCAVYVLASRGRVLYVGVTNDLARRMNEHRNRSIAGFTKRYNVTRLVYFEQTSSITSAIARERQLKGWTRSRKIALIEASNPTWRDLFEDSVP